MYTHTPTIDGMVRVNRLCELPRGFGSFPALETLDLTYNNLTSSSFSANFAYLGECLQALYMGDNDLDQFPPNIEKFVFLKVVGFQTHTHTHIRVHF